MVNIPASTLIHAMQNASINSFRDAGVLAVTIDRELLMAMPESPVPYVTKSGKNVVTVLSGDVPVARIEAQSCEDAADIALTLAELLEVESGEFDFSSDY